MSEGLGLTVKRACSTCLMFFNEVRFRYSPLTSRSFMSRVYSAIQLVKLTNEKLLV